MHRFARVLCVVWVVGAAVPAAPAQAPPRPAPPPKPKLERYLDRLELTPASVSFEIDYEGSPHTGCYQTMQAFAVYLSMDDEGVVWEEWENVSGQCGWSFGDPEIYTAYTGAYGNLSGAGLVVSWEWGPDHAGSTGVTVTFAGLSASGTITATDSRPPG